MTSSTSPSSILRPTPHPVPTSIAAIAHLVTGKLKELTRLGRQTIHCQWIRPQANTGTSRFFTVTLADTVHLDIIVDGIIWDQNTIQTILAEGHRLGIDLASREARCEVVLDATIECWAKKSKPYLKIHQLNTIGMKGLKHQQREAAIAQLDADGDLVRNTQRRWHVPTLRLALLTKPGSAACEDALSILRHSRFAIAPTVFPVSVQGAQAEATIVAAFHAVAARVTDFDAVLLVRGGGNEIDLLAYDLYAVALAVARCPLPVITGLGHQIDRSVCDLVAFRSVETPTAAAHYVVTQLEQVHAMLCEREHSIMTAIRRHTLSVTTVVLSLSQVLMQQTLLAVQAAHRTVLTTSARILHEHCQRRLHRAHRQLDADLQTVRQTMTESVIAPANRTLRRLPRDIQFSIQTCLGHRRTALHTWAAEVDAFDPTRLMARGFAIVTALDGQILHRPDTLTPKHRIKIQFLRHTVTATVTSIKERHP